MKVWWVFRSEHYYPESGLGNLFSTHETEEEAQSTARVLRSDSRARDYCVEVENITEHLGIVYEPSFSY